MGTGYHGGFGKTRGAVAGDAVFESPPNSYFANISKRTDRDVYGIYDVVAHGGKFIIQMTHGGRVITIDARIAARLIRNRPDYSRGQRIRLLACNTGASETGFAQNLANKLNVIVYAPTKLVWARPNGSHFVAGRQNNDPMSPDRNDEGYFKPFYPGGKKK